MLMSVCSLNDTATTDIYSYGHTLSLHDALPIFAARGARQDRHAEPLCPDLELPDRRGAEGVARDEHHAIILFLEQMRQFGDSGGLARPVDPDYQDDLRARKGVDVERFGDRAQDGSDLVGDDLAQIGRAHV